MGIIVYNIPQVKVTNLDLYMHCSKCISESAIIKFNYNTNPALLSSLVPRQSSPLNSTPTEVNYLPNSFTSSLRTILEIVAPLTKKASNQK